MPDTPPDRSLFAAGTRASIIAAVRKPSKAEGLQVLALTSRWDLRLAEDGSTVDLGIPGTADPKQKASTRHDD
jgi:hypothetical protein